jgi:hypothetical protein
LAKQIKSGSKAKPARNIAKRVQTNKARPPRKIVVQVVDQHGHPLPGALIRHFRDGKKGATVELGTRPAEYDLSPPSATMHFVVTYGGEIQEKTAMADDVFLRFTFPVPDPPPNANGNGTRLRYDTNTEGGSSGSPCLDAKLNLVALHHGGDPDTGRLAQYNQGIPIDRIVSHLAARRVVPPFWQ